MKKLLIICMVAVSALTACSPKQETSHEVQWSSDKKDSVVYVNYRNNDGSFTNFYMNYLLWSTLFRQGGYSSCYHYYQQHPSEFVNNNSYRSYTPRQTNYSTSSSISSLGKSFSTPSRSSSPSRSYSSPSRSYSSPSRSYSSPSRSYSSPSRSYSSPSRGR